MAAQDAQLLAGGGVPEPGGVVQDAVSTRAPSGENTAETTGSSCARTRARLAPAPLERRCVQGPSAVVGSTQRGRSGAGLQSIVAAPRQRHVSAAVDRARLSAPSYRRQRGAIAVPSSAGLRFQRLVFAVRPTSRTSRPPISACHAEHEKQHTGNARASHCARLARVAARASSRPRSTAKAFSLACQSASTLAYSSLAVLRSRA